MNRQHNKNIFQLNLIDYKFDLKMNQNDYYHWTRT